MLETFEIRVNASELLLSQQPPDFAKLGVLYTNLSVRVGNIAFPDSVWCDFAGLWLFDWYVAVWEMTEKNSRSARLPFCHIHEIWLRKTATPWWKLSLVERLEEVKIGREFLVLPEQVESALVTAIQRLLTGARAVGVWPDDCKALEQLVDHPRQYLSDLHSGKIPCPLFRMNKFRIPSL